MSNRKYPLSMFIMGFILELIKKRYILFLTLFLILVRIFIPDIPGMIPLVLVIIWLALAIINQLKIRKTILSMNADDKETNDMLDKMFMNNNKGHKNITDMLSEIISQNKDGSDY